MGTSGGTDDLRAMLQSFQDQLTMLFSRSEKGSKQVLRSMRSSGMCCKLRRQPRRLPIRRCY